MLRRTLLLVTVGLMCPTLTYGAPPPVPQRPSTPAPSSPPSDLSQQLLDGKTEQFYKEVIADEYAAFRTIQCVSKSITVDKFQFKNVTFKNIKNKIRSKEALFDYDGYKASIGEYYESLMQTYLITVFKELSQRSYKMISNELSEGNKKTAKVVSPFAREVQGIITNAITLAGPIARKIPEFQVKRTPDKSNTFHEYLNALPPKTLEQLNQCVTAIKFTADGLKEFQDNFSKDIKYYLSKNKAQSRLGEAPKKK